MFAPQKSIQDDSNLLADVRDLFSRRPETRYHEVWELQWLLFALGYRDDLSPVGVIASAVEVAHGDFDPDEGVA